MNVILIQPAMPVPSIYACETVDHSKTFDGSLFCCTEARDLLCNHSVLSNTDTIIHLAAFSAAKIRRPIPLLLQALASLDPLASFITLQTPPKSDLCTISSGYVDRCCRIAMHWQDWPSRWRTKDCQAACHELCSFVLFLLQKGLALHAFTETWEMIFIGQDQPTLEKRSLKLCFFNVFWLILKFLPVPCSVRVDENEKVTIWFVIDWMYLVLARLDDWIYWGC